MPAYSIIPGYGDVYAPLHPAYWKEVIFLPNTMRVIVEDDDGRKAGAVLLGWTRPGGENLFLSPMGYMATLLGWRVADLDL